MQSYAEACKHRQRAVMHAVHKPRGLPQVITPDQTAAGLGRGKQLSI
jgi:hypothetical protein